MIKTFAVIAVMLALPASASADLKATAPGPTIVGPQVAVAVVKGALSVPPALLTGDFSKLPCGQIEIVASSKELKKCPPGADICVPDPVWTRQVKANGNIATGQCNYALLVRPNEPFVVSATSTFMIPHPRYPGWTVLTTSLSKVSVTVEKEPKTHDFAVTGIFWASPGP